MDMLVLDPSNLGEGLVSFPPTERLVAGAPRFTTWKFTATKDGQIGSGIWEATPGTWISKKEGVWEFCTILSGVSILTEDGGAARRLVAGDTIVLQPDFTGVWEVLETTRKVYVTRAPQ